MTSSLLNNMGQCATVTINRSAVVPDSFSNKFDTQDDEEEEEEEDEEKDPVCKGCICEGCKCCAKVIACFAKIFICFI